MRTAPSLTSGHAAAAHTITVLDPETGKRVTIVVPPAEP